MAKSRKGVRWFKTEAGYELKMWVTRAGKVFPTHWKKQAGMIAGEPVKVSK